MLLLLTRDVAFKFSPLRLVSSFGLSTSQEHVIGIQRERTSQRLKIADLSPISVTRMPICDTDSKKKRNRAGFKTWPLAFCISACVIGK